MSRILIVDDDISWIKFYKYQLSKEGVKEVDIAHTKENAAELITKHEYDLAIIDLRLIDHEEKNFDGIEVITKIRQISTKTKIIVMSGFLNPETIEKLGNLAVNEIIDKSDPIQKLIEKSKQIINNN